MSTAIGTPTTRTGALRRLSVAMPPVRRSMRQTTPIVGATSVRSPAIPRGPITAVAGAWRTNRPGPVIRTMTITMTIMGCSTARNPRRAAPVTACPAPHHRRLTRRGPPGPRQPIPHAASVPPPPTRRGAWVRPFPAGFTARVIGSVARRVPQPKGRVTRRTMSPTGCGARHAPPPNGRRNAVVVWQRVPNTLAKRLATGSSRRANVPSKHAIKLPSMPVVAVNRLLICSKTTR